MAGPQNNNNNKYNNLAQQESLKMQIDNLKGDICKKLHTSRRRRQEIRRLRSDTAKRIRDVSDTTASSSSSSSSSPESSATTRSAPPSDSDGDGSGAAVAGEARVSEAKAHVRSACASHGMVSIVGRRREMEDAVAVKTQIGMTSSRRSAYDFFGVYDGHGGARVAAACRERMHVVLADVVGGEWPEGEGEEARWREVMSECFARVDEDVSAAAAGADAAQRTVGSTAVVAVLGAEKIVVANCGDSRAVLCRGGVAVPLSSDHKV